MSTTFTAFYENDAFASELRSWEIARTTPIPICVVGRPDLAEAVAIGNELYDGVEVPEPADIGVQLSHLAASQTAAFIDPLARYWVPLSDVQDNIDRLFRAKQATVRVLCVGTYDTLTSATVKEILLRSHREPRLQIGFLSGRDQKSLFWLAAKQWAQISHRSDGIGFFSDIDAPKDVIGASIFGPKTLEQATIGADIVSRRWRTVLFQGHGKDDSINLGDWTICGLNPFVVASDGKQRPRCGYGFACYKEQTKLVPVRRVPSCEVVLCSCNSGAFSDLALYDPKYILLLSAIDGPAKRVTSAVTVHSAATPENAIWIETASRGLAASAHTLNESLRAEHPYPAFWHFGLPTTPEPLSITKSSSTIIALAERAQAYVASGLLNSRHRFHRRFAGLNLRLLNGLSRSQRLRPNHEGASNARSIADEVQSIDFAMAELVANSPEDDLMNFGTYFGTRAEMTDVIEEPCTCGRPAFAFTRKGLISTIPDIRCVFCFRCGDTVFRWPGTPILKCVAPETIEGGELDVQIDIAWSEPGPVRFGVFVPPYMRAQTTIEPVLSVAKAKADRIYSKQVKLRFSTELPPQAYYFTAFAIQNLGISTLRRHFGIHRTFPDTRAPGPGTWTQAVAAPTSARQAIPQPELRLQNGKRCSNP